MSIAHDRASRAAAYDFQPMCESDLPLARHWLVQPHVAEWWGDPVEQFALVSGDLGHPEMAQFVVHVQDRPFAYLQCYNLSAWNAGFGPQPDGTRGLDQFIGEADMLGGGHGSAFIREFTENLLARGVPRVVIDPDPGNRRAIRAYEKAGFVEHSLVDTPDGIALLMVRDS